MLFKTPYYYNYSYIYTIAHIITGLLLAFFYYMSAQAIYKTLFMLLLLCIFSYQGIQLFLNIRIFINKLEIKSGNSLEHTINKLFEYLIGFIVGYSFSNISLPKV